MKRMWGLYDLIWLLVPLQFLITQEASGCNRRAVRQDSLVIAKSNQRIVINQHTPTVSIQLKTTQQPARNANKKYCLLMAGILLKQPPEGIYEVFISPAGTNPVTAESPYFIDVLDTYTMASSGKTERICLDVTQQLLKQESRNNQLLSYSVTVRFKGNLLPDSTSSRNAGLLSIDTVQLLQLNR